MAIARRLLTLIAGKGHGVMEALSDGGWLWRETTATQAGVSPSAADETFSELAAFRLAQKRRAGRRIEWSLTDRGKTVWTLLETIAIFATDDTGLSAAVARVLEQPPGASAQEFYCLAFGEGAAAGQELIEELAAQARARGATSALRARLSDVRM